MKNENANGKKKSNEMNLFLLKGMPFGGEHNILHRESSGIFQSQIKVDKGLSKEPAGHRILLLPSENVRECRVTETLLRSAFAIGLEAVKESGRSVQISRVPGQREEVVVRFELLRV